MSVADLISEALFGTGLFVRGGFHPVAEDGVPRLADGRAAATRILIGNACRDLWRAFRRGHAVIEGSDPRVAWIDGHIERAAKAAGAEIVFATRPPWPPIMRWAMRAEPVHRSPLGLLIHPEFGLWHVYRAAFLFAERLDLPPPAAAASPCDSCADKPCLSTCPVDAFAPGSFDSSRCVDHVESPSGRACTSGGCLARRACPVGRHYAYDREAGAFHMAAVVRAVRKMQLRAAGRASSR